MTEDERRLGETALRKVEAQKELEECRDQLKSAVSKVDLPVTVHLDGKCVVILKPQKGSGGLPQCVVYRSVYE